MAMGSRLRLIEPNIVFAGAQRCNDRAFLFKPNHRADNKLLALSCDPDSFDLKNNKHPVPSIMFFENVVGAFCKRPCFYHDTKRPFFPNLLSSNSPRYTRRQFF